MDCYCERLEKGEEKNLGEFLQKIQRREGRVSGLAPPSLVNFCSKKSGAALLWLLESFLVSCCIQRRGWVLWGALTACCANRERSRKREEGCYRLAERKQKNKEEGEGN
jgi:hypothetical protein